MGNRKGEPEQRRKAVLRSGIPSALFFRFPVSTSLRTDLYSALRTRISLPLSTREL
jgi:hypothetical protein